MSIAPLLAELRRLDVHVWAEGDQLRCNAPAGALTAALRDRLREQKADIVRFLRATTRGAQPRAIVPIQPHGGRVPLFAVGGHNGDVFCFRALSRYLGNDQPFFGLQPPGLDGEADPFTTIEDLAGFFATQISLVRPRGPVSVAGYCAGGAIAFEMARRLLRDGREVECVALLAGRYPTWFRPLGQARHRLRHYLDRFARHARALASTRGLERGRYLADMVDRLRTTHGVPAAPDPDPILKMRARVQEATFRAVCRYQPSPTPLRLCLFLPSPAARRSADGLLRWQRFAPTVEVYCGPAGCEGDAMLLEPNVRLVADQFQRCIRRAREPSVA